MALTAEQTQGLQDQYKKLRLGGMDAASAQAKLKESMISAGVYDTARSAYQSQANTTEDSIAIPVAKAPSVTPYKSDGNYSVEPVKDLGKIERPAKRKDDNYSILSVSDGSPSVSQPVNSASPVNVSATPRGSAARSAIVPSAPSPVAAEPSGATGQTIPEKPVQPSATVAPKVETTKTAEDRSKEILTNLQEGQKSSPQLFQDYDTFKGAYGYETKPAEEKAQLDAFWNAQNKRTPDQLIDMALSGQDLTPYKGTPEYITASRIGKAVSGYSKMTAPQLSEAMGSMEADLLPGSKGYAVLSKANPQLVAEAERIKDANRRSGIISFDENGKPKTNRVPDAEVTISDSITSDVDSTAVPTLAAALGTPEITKAREKASATKDELNGLYDTLESVEDDVRAELKGTGATESYIRALISERTKPLMKQVNSLERRYANEAGDLKALTESATDSFKYSWQLASEERQSAREKALIAYKNSLEATGNKTDLVDLGNQKVLIDKATGKVITSFDVSKPLTDKFEFRTETDNFGNQTTAIFDKQTGKKISGGGEGVSAGGSSYSEAVSYLANAGYETTPAIVKTLAGRTMDEVRAMYPVKEGMTVSGKPQTEGQVLATGFAERIGRASNGISNLESYLSSLNPAEFYAYSSKYVPNLAKPEKFQKYEQFAREFITAQLRKESGAAISDSEFETARKQYFPQPGDSKSVIDQKRKSREAAYQNMVTATGLKNFNPSPVENVSGQTNKAQSFRVVGSTQDNVAQLKQLARKNPIDAGPKYNNLGGITFRGANGKQMPFVETMKKAGIQFEEGGARGVGGKEGGTYVKFKTVGDGMDAYNLLWKTKGFQSLTVKDALTRWGTGNVNLPAAVMSGKVSDADKSTISKLKALQISKESPAMFQYLKDNGLLKNL